MPQGVKHFVEKLGWLKALESLPKVNITMVQEFYANFPTGNIKSEIRLRSDEPIMVWVRGVR